MWFDKILVKFAVPFTTTFMILCIPVWYGLIGYAFDHKSIMEGVVTFLEFAFSWAVMVWLRDIQIKSIKELKELKGL